MISNSDWIFQLAALFEVNDHLVKVWFNKCDSERNINFILTAQMNKNLFEGNYSKLTAQMIKNLFDGDYFESTKMLTRHWEKHIAPNCDGIFKSLHKIGQNVK